MYKLILCWRYLKTRYLALACIISVMLGVATLIVVNSVMNGFSKKLQTLLHNVVSDVAIEAHSPNGFYDPEGKIARIRKDPYLNDRIQSMAITLESFAMLQFTHRGSHETVTRPVRVMGIEMKSRSAVGGFQNYLEKQKKAEEPTFAIPKEIQVLFEKAEKDLNEFRELEFKQEQDRIRKLEEAKKQGIAAPPPIQSLDFEAGISPEMKEFFGNLRKERAAPPVAPPPMPVPHKPRVPMGAIIGHLVANYKGRDENNVIHERQAIITGDRIDLTTITIGERMAPVYDSFVAVDFFKSGMSEYDANCVFVPLEHLQKLRGMTNRATNILVKLKDQNDADDVVKAMAVLFKDEPITVNTWQEKQGPLLRAIEIEKSILNILLFMIVGVAGFGILAIFSMIVSEKTRDIGILKALGASSGGVMQIFLSYGLLLGVVGSLLGTILGVTITMNINAIELAIAAVTGQRIFSGDVYYFTEIPTELQPMAILIMNLGAIGIAVVFSIIPAMRAAMLHPVQALRYD